LTVATTQSRAAETASTSPSTFAVTNPATGEVVANVPSLDMADVEALVARARAAQPAWQALGFKERGNLMLDLRAWLVKNRKKVAEALVAEAGKTYEDGLIEVTYSCEALGFWAKQAPRYLRDEKLKPRTALMVGKRVVVRNAPRGVIGVIAPWNYPLVLGFGDVIPALMAGNAVVLKPSSVTPLSSMAMIQDGMVAVGFPADVCLLATGPGRTGSALVDTCDMIMFTGSTETGKMIAERAARRLIPVSLELGGKDPMLVLSDADLERATDVAVSGGLTNAGQTCMSVERIYVEEPVYDQFVQILTDKVSKLRTGVPGTPGTIDIGSMTGPGQSDIVDQHVRDAVAKGARVLTGGKRRAGAGDFYEPTVLVDVDHTMACMTEETFGPTLPVMKVRDVEEGLRLANDSPYGLNSSVFTRDLARGEEVASRIEAGNACVNDALTNYFELRAPFSGWKTSGLGGRHGAEGIKKYCKQQTVLTTRFAPPKDPLAYPRTKMTAKMLEATLVLLYRKGRRR
jgi:acyl-CoA reductase-like NAD-dependent aldehyde dehydrogenase